MKSPRQRQESDKDGVFLNLYVIHPLTNEKIPVWLANFVLADYGDGAVMAVPAHDERDYEFASKFNLAIKQSIKPQNGKDAREKIIAKFENLGIGKKVENFKLRDWGVSRQRYWGAPIPMIHCKTCGLVPEALENLPVTLPEDIKITGKST